MSHWIRNMQISFHTRGAKVYGDEDGGTTTASRRRVGRLTLPVRDLRTAILIV